MDFINQMEPSFDKAEADALYEYMNAGGWVTEFKKTREFETQIANFTQSNYCSVVANGTIALVTALLACGVTVGDEVIVPDYTMVATANAPELIGAKTVFADINRKNLCLDFEQMKSHVTSKTKAVILVSINGRYPENIEQFVQYCKENNIYLIEDAAQSLGSLCKGKHIGCWGDIGCFSFSAPKIITTGQGGALITDNPSVFEKIKKIRDFGRDKSGSDHYLVKGWNFKFTDIQAVIGIEQMKKLSKRIMRKKEMGRLYNTLLNDIAEVELIPTNFDNTAPWFFDMLCEDRNDLIHFLKQENIGTRPFYPALHSEPAYAYDVSFPVAEEISQKGLWLPSSITLTNEQITYICNKIKEFYMKKHTTF